MRFKVSSTSSRQSMTASWCSAAYFGWPSTTCARPVIPRYLRLWFSDCRNLEMDLAASSSNVEFG